MSTPVDSLKVGHLTELGRCTASTRKYIEYLESIDGDFDPDIAHRLSTIRQADHIVFINKGRIVEEGSHEELIALKGRYRDLHRMQQTSKAY